MSAVASPIAGFYAPGNPGVAEVGEILVEKNGGQSRTTVVGVTGVPTCVPASPRRRVVECAPASEPCAPKVTTTCSTVLRPRTVKATAYQPVEVCNTVYDKITTQVTTECPPEPKPCPPPCAPACAPACAPKACDPCASYGWGHSFWSFFIIFIVIAIIVALILWVAQPNFILNHDAQGNPIAGDINVGRLILWAIIIGLILGFIIWLIWSCVC